MRGLLVGLIGLLLLAPTIVAQDAWNLTVDGDVGSGTVTYLARGIREALDAGAPFVTVTFSTPGGLLESAVAARNVLLDAPLPTIAYVSREALSAGALLAIACETILFAPGGVLGAATPVLIGGDAIVEAPEKVVSGTRSIFRATAEVRGRDLQLAEAMVDRDIAIEGVIEAGKLLTLTSQQAADLGYSDGETDDLEAWAIAQGADGLADYDSHWSDSLIEFLTTPLAVGLLITIGLIGLIAEMLIPGFGIPGIVGIVCLGAFFWSHFLVGLAGWESIAFLLGGIVAILLEIFAFTAVDFGFAGLLGLVLIGLGFYTAMVGPFTAREHAVQAIGIVAGGLVFSVVVSIVLLARLPKTKLRLGGVILSSAVTGRSYDRAVAGARKTEWEGRRGVAASDLRPVGTGEFDGDRTDVVCEEGHLPKGTPIVVVRDEGYRRVVRRLETSKED